MAPPTISVGDLLSNTRSPVFQGEASSNYTTTSGLAVASSNQRTRSRKPTTSALPATPDLAAEREVLISQLLDLQEIVRGLVDRVETARNDHTLKTAENAVLLKYINNLMAAGGAK
ncbi:hypothetical protein BDR26DRAFT_874733 [Obelidium mucronatum]|nr:hypothetical protein BDR26DRAFT_874733 [Obelidium mucronatum]